MHLYRSLGTCIFIDVAIIKWEEVVFVCISITDRRGFGITWSHGGMVGKAWIIAKLHHVCTCSLGWGFTNPDVDL